MLKSLYRSVVAASAAMTIISCTPELAPQGDETSSYTLKFSSERPQMKPDSRTFWNGEDVLWSDGDRIGVTYCNDGAWAAAIYPSEALAEDCEVAEFSVPVDVGAVSGKSIRFHAVYPSSCIKGNFSSAPEVEVLIPSVQTPSSSSFDPSADLMAARAVETFTGIPSEPVPLLWKRLVAHADITVTLPDIPSDESLVSVTLTADEAVHMTGSYLLDLSSRTFAPKESEEDFNSVTVMTGNIEVSGGKMRMWISVLPCTLSSLEVTIKTDKAFYTRQIPSCDLALKANVRGVLSLDMSSAARRGMPDAAKNALINDRLFDVVDLNADGMQTVREYHEDGYIYEAAQALRDYYRTRTNVVNPSVDLSVTKSTDEAENIADQALKENGYRFYIANYVERTEKGKDVYYSFEGEDGGIDWEYAPVTETQFLIQKHRHQWMKYQAQVYWTSKDEKYVKSFVEVYSDWLETYPCPVAGQKSYAIASSHPLYDMWTDLQTTSRTTSQLDILEYIKGSESLTPEFFSDFMVAFHDGVECMLANKYYEPASNHRLYEVHAIYHAAVLMPEFVRSEAWLSDALTDLSGQIDIQFAEDGVQNEMDPSYHISVVNSFYEIYKLALVNARAEELPSGFVEKLKAAAMFVRDVVYPDHSLENFNDTRAVSWTKSVLKKNFTKYAEMFPDEDSFAWMATEGKSGAAPESLATYYQKSGWYMLRSGWDASDMMLILKNNYNARPWWHCQPDNGTIALYRNGRHFLPDAGVYTYGGSAADNALRNQYRSTAMHNTLTLDGATIADNSMLGTCKGTASTDVYDMAHSSNQSYGALRHERAVYRIKDGFFVVVDFALGSATGSVGLNWHFCPGKVVFSSDSESYSCKTAFEDGNDMLFKTFCFKGTALTSDFAGTTGTSSTSSAIGKSEQRPCCRISVDKTTTSTPIRFITVIYPFGNVSDIPQISAVFNSATRITVTIGDEDYSLATF